MNQGEIHLKKGIVHILDSSLGYPVYSEEELEFDIAVSDFFEGHINKILNGDDLKKCYFAPDEEDRKVYDILKELNDDNFVEVSKKLADNLYEIMNSNLSIPAADFAVIRYKMDEHDYLALLKMNYKESYVHMTNAGESGNVNQIICYRATLPMSTQKLTEAVIINLTDYTVSLIEKKYEVNGEKINYLSELFLKCHANMSSKTKMNIVSKTVEQINKKHFDTKPEKQLEAKSIIKKEIEETGSVNVEKISEKIYGDVPEIKEEFDDKMEKYHMKKAEVTPNSESTTRKFKKQYIKTDTGIEINIPMEQYQDGNIVEFITNEDGTISVLIKNINKILTR